MEYISLGATAEQIPKIGFGTWQYRGGAGVLKRAAELGAGFVDTAEAYGTEPIVGREIAAFRDDMFVATKVSASNLRYDDVIEHAEASLRRLQVSVIDLYQVHWPNPDIPIAETMRAMETLVAEGKVRFIGVSNFSPSQMREAQDSLKDNPLAANQVRYSLFAREIEDEVLPYCQENDITVIAYTPIARGVFDSPGEALREVAAEIGATPAQVMLKLGDFARRGNGDPQDGLGGTGRRGCGVRRHQAERRSQAAICFERGAQQGHLHSWIDS